MPSRKRAFDEVEPEKSAEPSSLLKKIRNSWELASLCQYIFFFGKILKIREEVDIEYLETECVTPGPSPKLLELGVSLLKWVSSQRGLTPELFDEYTRRQYNQKAPHRENPFGADPLVEPKKFDDFDIFLKLRVLHQLTIWTFWNPNKLRELLAEKESEQTNWRIEPFGWDAEDRIYYLLDDNRLYRRTEPPPPASPVPKSKTKSKPKPKPKALPPRARGSRSSKRQKLLNGHATEDEEENTEEVPEQEEESLPVATEEHFDMENGLGGAKWEVVAISLSDYTDLMNGICRSRDPNERALHKRLQQEVLPIIERVAEASERRAKQRQRDLDNLARMATAKRSSRLQDKQDKKREAELEAEDEKRKQAERDFVAQELEKQRRIELEREERIQTREQRLKEREVKRIMHEQELARLEEAKDQGDEENVRWSERQLKAEEQRQQKELELLKAEDDDEEWCFDCSICGRHGKNLDDGTHSIACEKCGVWEHSLCHKIAEADAERDDFHFLCKLCSKPKVSSLKLKLSPPSVKSQPAETNGHPVVGNPPKLGTFELPRSSKPTTSSNGHGATLQSLQEDHPMLDAPTSYTSPGSPIKASAPSLPAAGVLGVNGIATASNSQDHNLDRAQGHARATSLQHDTSLSQVNGTKPWVPPSSRQQSSPAPPIQRTPQQSFSSTTTQSTPHNPFLNDFTRQRPSSAHSNKSFASPAPPLTATEGNTDVRFSPSQKPGSPRSQSYAPSAQPAPAAYSPVKHDAPSPRQPTVSSFAHHSPTPPQSQDLSAYSNSFPAPASTAAPSSPQRTPAQPVSSTPNGLMSSPHLPPASSMQLPPAPTLSPSVNAGEQNLHPPVKRAMPENPPGMSLATFNSMSPPSSSH